MCNLKILTLKILLAKDEIMSDAPWLPIFLDLLFGVIMIGIICMCSYFLIKRIDRNGSFGYRNKLTLSSDEIWQWANKRAMWIIIISMVISLFVDIATLIIMFKYNLEWFYCFIPAIFMVVILLIDVVILNIWIKLKCK